MRSRSPLSLGLPVLATLVVAVSTVIVATVAELEPSPLTDARSLVAGIVLGENGAALPDAQVWIGARQTRSGTDGRFTIESDSAVVLTASAEGHLPRSVTAEPGTPVEVRLTGESARTVSLRFGGDVMFGRRYFAQTAKHGPLLKADASAHDIADVLSEIGPLLDDSDLTVLNLETALIPDPWDGEGKRPSGLHPTKDLVITSPVSSAKALAEAGVEVVSLANNHVFDGLDAGLKRTIDALDAAGVSHYGAGPTIAEAWRPAIVTVRGHQIAFVGCTTIDGRHSQPSYVAEATHGGAAECNPKLLTSAIQQARRSAPLVVVSIHGGAEYRRSQTPDVRALATTAQQAGAQLIVGSHPHVIGGLSHQGASVFAESLGNLSFDQDLWATLPSYLLRVDARFAEAGTGPAALVSARTDPILIDDYRPRPAVGNVAESVARIASGWVEGGAIMDRASAAIQFRTQGPPAVAQMQLAKDEVRRISPGWWLAPAPGGGDQVRAGTDLLFGTGSFEPTAVGSQAGRVPLWSPGKYASVSRDASCQPGGRGALLVRTPLSTEPAIMSPDHRSPVVQGQSISLLANVRQASRGSRLEVHWYGDMSGPSTSVSTLKLPSGAWSPGSCQRVRFNMTVPKKAQAAQVFIVLEAPEGGQTIRRLAIDDLSLVDWAPKGRSGRRYDMVGGLRSGMVTFQSDSSDAANRTPVVR